MRISIVVAMANNRVIGAGGNIPWRLPDDQHFFKELTIGHTLVMGRATYESIGRPLPDRTTIVLSRDASYAPAGVITASGLDAAIALARAAGESQLFIVGGEAVYAEALEKADVLHLTRVDATVDGDVSFPDWDENEWKRTAAAPHPTDDRHAHPFSIERWERVG